MDNDEILVKKALNGDMSAFDELVARYDKRVLSTAFGLLSDYHDACDASQEVFLRVYKSLSSFKGGSSFSTWIYRITVNICNDFLRKRKSQGVTISIDANDEDTPITEIPDTAATPHEQAERSELSDMVRKEISRLPEEYRTALTLCEIDGLSYDKIAEILKCPVGTVKSRINRAKKTLRKNLEGKRELFL